MRIATYEKIFSEQNKIVLVDVRTSKEYDADHIPSAINIPLFTNSEHELVGTLFKQESVEAAKIKGIEFISKNLPSMYQKYLDIYNENKGHKIVLYCARGGMRSTSIGQLLSTLGMNITKIDGGYKKYRQFVRENLDNELDKVRFCTLYGKTGCSKTKILKKLSEEGHSILDLEGYANHRGSLLGHIGLLEQNSQKKFESLLFHNLVNRKSDIIFTEGESKRIGKIVLPEKLYSKLKSESQIEIISPINIRVKEIKEEYINERFKDEEVLLALNKMKAYMSNQNFDMFKELLSDKNYEELIEQLMVLYYDNVYNDKHEHIIGEVEFKGDYRKTIDDILKLSNL